MVGVVEVTVAPSENKVNVNHQNNTLYIPFAPGMVTMLTLYWSPPHGGYVVMLLRLGMVTKNNDNF